MRRLAWVTLAAGLFASLITFSSGADPAKAPPKPDKPKLVVPPETGELKPITLPPGALPPEEDLSAPIDGNQPVETNTPLTEEPIKDDDRLHWSFAPLKRTEPPQPKNSAWPRNEVDRFILARLEKEGLAPMPVADRVTLARRLSFDLTGLPPTPAEVDAFVADKSEDAYEQFVDRLLAKPAYGERQSQHWLDLARFAESDGFEHDIVRPEAWKYRDWVIGALNRDVPYDDFVRLQLAADEIAPKDPSQLVATHFCLCGPDMPDINLQEERRHEVMNEMAGTVGSVLMGLQFGCAQCHDHKYDPISQADFYRLRAFFDNADLFTRQVHDRVLTEKNPTGRTSHLMLRGDFRRKGAVLTAAYPRIINPKDEQVPAPATGAKTSGRRTALANWLMRPENPLTTRVMVNRLWQQHFGQALAKQTSDFGIMGDEPTHPELLDWLATEFPRRDWSLKAMHRLLVTTATYRQASRPTGGHWNTGELKAAAASWAASKKADPGNDLLARMPRQRLDGEAIRDAMLVSSGRLSSRTGGPGIMAPLPQELVATLLKNQWKVAADEEDHRRRSIYLFVRRNLRYPLFEAFDRPDTNASCPRRNRSTVAPQALVLLNSEFTLSQSRDLAGSLMADAKPSEGGVDWAVVIMQAYRRVLSRTPTAEELKLGEAFLKTQAERIAKLQRKPKDLALPKAEVENLTPEQGAALVDFCLAMFNLNEMVYVD